jgi:hypothetical protein
MGADNIDTPPPPDSPLPGSDKSLGGPDASPRRDEATPATDAADSPATATGPDSPAPALTRDEGHSLTTETAPRADGSKSLRDKAKHVVVAGLALANAIGTEVATPVTELSRLPSAGVSQTMVSTADAVGTIEDALGQGGNLFTEVSAVVRGEPDQPAEHPAAAPNPEIPVDKAPDPAGPDGPDSEDLNALADQERKRIEEQAEADKAALETRPRDQFPRAQSSPKASDQVRDRRPTPTGRGGSRGRPK